MFSKSRIILVRNWYFFKKNFLKNILWELIEPVTFILAFGYGVGSFIPTISEISYLQFIYPGILCACAMLVAFRESAWVAYDKIFNTSYFQLLQRTPISSQEIFLGEILWSSCKSLIVCLPLLILGKILNIVDQSLLLFLVLALVSFISSIFGYLIVCKAKSFNGILKFSMLVMFPISIFSEVYFPTQNLAAPLNVLLKLSPLSHAVQMARQVGSNKILNLENALHLFVLLTVSVLLYRFTKATFVKRLKDYF